jgi:UDPglucose 6-dehydrogenase
MEELGVDSTLVKAIDDINQHAVGRFIKKIEHEAQPLEGKKIAILGLSFKPNTDDIRNAAALKVIDALQIGGAELRVFDPKAMQHVKKLHPNLTYAVDAYAAVQGCEAAVICTEWPEFEQLDLEKLKASMAKPILFDGRNVIHKAEAIKLGFTYFGVGE